MNKLFNEKHRKPMASEDDLRFTVINFDTTQKHKNKEQE